MRWVLKPLAALAIIVAIYVANAPSRAPSPHDLAGPQISARAVQHIIARHGPQSQATDAGKFAAGTDEARLIAEISEAIRGGTPHADTNGRPATLYDYDFPAPIGATAEGRPTRRLRVVVAPDGAVITAYPR